MPSSTIPASGGGGLSPKFVKYTSSGTFTLPDGYGVAKPLLVSIQVLGGGGGGSMFGNAGGTYYASWSNYFGQQYSTPVTSIFGNGRGGGSGGLCATNLYLTSNLSFTIGAAGAGIRSSSAENQSRGPNGNPNDLGFDMGVKTGSTGGTTTAGVLQATGGTGAVISTNVNINNGNGRSNMGAQSAGTGGTPAGTAGEATPLLGTLAGGSTSATPIRGSFGVGGINTDNLTSTGAEGTGGGGGSVGAPGAVILIYWS